MYIVHSGTGNRVLVDFAIGFTGDQAANVMADTLNTLINANKATLGAPSTANSSGTVRTS